LSFGDAPDADAYEERRQKASAEARPYPNWQSRCPSLSRTMRGAKPSSFLALPHVHAETEASELSAHPTPMSFIVDSCEGNRNRWPHRLQFRQPFRQRVARPERLKTTGWCKADLDPIALGHFEKSCSSQNSTSSRSFGPPSGVHRCSPSP
jgi:hypothetical protein